MKEWAGPLSLLSTVGWYVALSVMVLFYLMFRLYVKMDELDQTITKMVREIAISKAKK